MRAKHCESDRRVCRINYCACQCDDCYEAHFGNPRPDEKPQATSSMAHTERTDGKERTK